MIINDLKNSVDETPASMKSSRQRTLKMTAQLFEANNWVNKVLDLKLPEGQGCSFSEQTKIRDGMCVWIYRALWPLSEPAHSLLFKWLDVEVVVLFRLSWLLQRPTDVRMSSSPQMLTFLFDHGRLLVSEFRSSAMARSLSLMNDFYAACFLPALDADFICN